jgi:hypothetical protein
MAGESGFDSHWAKEIFLFSIMFRVALGIMQPSVKWVQIAVSLGIQQQEHEADHSHPV